MIEAFSPLAIEAHCARAEAEGGERIVRTWPNLHGYLVEIVWFCGEECLRITAPGVDYRNCSVVVWSEQGGEFTVIPNGDGMFTPKSQIALPRSIMHALLKPDGSIERAAVKGAVIWLRLMGRDVTQKEIHKLLDILTTTWPDFFNVVPDFLAIQPTVPVAHVKVTDQRGRVLDEREV